MTSVALGDKRVVHNYGHGGGGISLAWGSSGLALREVAGLPPGRAAVIGSGVMGLTSARLLQDAGWAVTIYTRATYRHTTSNVAAGEWSPFSVFEESRVTRAFLSRFEWAARISHHAYTNLGPRYGVRWIEAYQLSERPFADREFLADLFPYTAVLDESEHPFPVPYVRRRVTMKIEPAVLLRRLAQDFLVAGGRFEIRAFGERDELLALPEPVIFNCTGLGAAALFGDEELVPAKGQLVFLPPDPAVDYFTVGGGSDLLYMFSRSDALVLGGTFSRGDHTGHAEPRQTERIVAENKRIFDNFRAGRAR